MTSSSRRRDVPAEGSWRLIDGENDSFDMSIVDPIYGDDPVSPPSSSGVPSSGYPTQQSFSLSQNNTTSFYSQDSIRDFSNYQDDEQVILREPFRPSLPSTAAMSMQRDSSWQSPEMQLRMPRVDADSFVANNASRTARGGAIPEEDEWGSDEETLFESMERTGRRTNGRRRNNESSSKPAKGRGLQLSRIFSKYIVAPATVLILAILVYRSDVSLQTITGQLDSISWGQPLSSIAASFPLAVPFPQTRIIAKPPNTAAISPVDFSNLMGVQSKLEGVLDKSSQGVSMPLELKRSEMATRSLRSLLKESDIPSKEDLIAELNSYIQKVGRAASDLQYFYIHIGSTVDSIIDINRWTLRHIKSLSMEPDSSALSTLLSWSSALLSPLGLWSSGHTAKDRVLLDKYAEHIILVQARLDKLIDQGTALSLLLYHSQNHLTNIHEQAKRTSRTATLKSDSLLSSIWAYVGSMMEEQRNLDEQIALLKRVDTQYASTISHLLALIEDLKDIQVGLGDLLQRSEEPQVVWGEDEPADQTTTLSAQFDIIQNALRKLETARKRATQIESGSSQTDVTSAGVDEKRHAAAET